MPCLSYVQCIKIEIVLDRIKSISFLYVVVLIKLYVIRILNNTNIHDLKISKPSLLATNSKDCSIVKRMLMYSVKVKLLFSFTIALHYLEFLFTYLLSN
jgi:hypothetical protein